MLATTKQPNETSEAKERLLGLLDYIDQLARLTETPVLKVDSYKSLCFLEHQLQNRVGIHHDMSDEEGPTWLQVERLQRSEPPIRDELVEPWLKVSRDPTRQPEVFEQRLELMSRQGAEALIAEGTVDANDVMESPAGNETFVDVRFRLDRLPEVQRAINHYLLGPWQEWSEQEKPRRETIAIYDKFFRLVQKIEAEGTENPTEVVWGMGMVLWKTGDLAICHPLIESLVEVAVNPTNQLITVRPRQIHPQIYLRPFEQAECSGVSQLREAAEKYILDVFDNSNLDDEGEGGLSPFAHSEIDDLLRLAVAKLSSHGVFYPDILTDASDRTIPDLDDRLVVTDTWAIYARPRGGNFFARDVDRLKEELEGLDEDELPKVGKRLVCRPSDELSPDASSPMLGPLAHPPDITNWQQAASDKPEVYFPKAFNDAQLEVVRRLEETDGVVVQGPPGTGKTHTIANIICHYLATGRNVLITSKGEPALQVLRGHIPEGVRDLTISLLSSERVGYEQLERAVTFISNEVVDAKEDILRREIRDCEENIKRQKTRISSIDQEIAHFAKLHLSPVAKILADGPDIRPAELAISLVENRGAHAWLEDRLGFEGEYDPQFTDEEVAAARTSRRRVGPDLVYLGCTLASPNDLPDLATISEMHKDLIRSNELSQSAEKDGVPIMSSTSSDALERGERLLELLEELRTFHAFIANRAWIQGLYGGWQSSALDSEQIARLDQLLERLGSIVESRNRFLEKPVQYPEPSRHREALIDAVNRARSGKRPFPLLSLGSSEVKDLFSKIRIAHLLPSGRHEWDHVARFFDFQNEVAAFIAQWNACAGELILPRLRANYSDTIRKISDLHQTLQRARYVVNELTPEIGELADELFPQGIDSRIVSIDSPATECAINAVKSNLLRIRLSTARIELESTLERLHGYDGGILDSMCEFLRLSVGNEACETDSVRQQWQDLLRELERIRQLVPDFEAIDHIADRIERSGAPIWARKLRREPVVQSDDYLTPVNWIETWRSHRLESYLKKIDGRETLRKLADERRKLGKRLENELEKIVRFRTHLGLKRRMSDARLAALKKFLYAITKMPKSKRAVSAGRYRGDARAALEECLKSAPCWIMPTWRVSETLPSEIGSFDLVIVDEASQSDAMAVPALLRAKKVLVVGDDRQVSPTPIGLEERKLLQLRQSYLKGQPNASMLMPGASLYDLATVCFPGERILLNEHFRCVEPIIRFSFRFYPEKIHPLRIPKASERIDPPLVDVYVKNGQRDNQKINLAEAFAIVDEIEAIVHNDLFRNRSLGVVCLLGREQAHYIQNLLLDRIGEDRYLRHRIACGDPATFQGKERDIMLVSMVASPGKAAAQTTFLYKQRFNVALSRARDRMYLFRSVGPEDLKNPRDLKLQVMEHFNNPMPAYSEEVENLIDLCESEFERSVFSHLVARGYRTTPQVRVGEFRIDLVVEGDDDRRLAVELDGDSFHGPDRWLEDWNRQKILERAGWRFWRCWASSYYMDPEACMDDLELTLMELNIEPMGSIRSPQPYTEHRTIEISLDWEDSTPPFQDSGEEPRIQVGDKVVLEFQQDAQRVYTWTISEDEHDELNGIIAANHPLGKALIGAHSEDEVILPWKGESEVATIRELEKSTFAADARATDLESRQESKQQRSGLAKPTFEDATDGDSVRSNNTTDSAAREIDTAFVRHSTHDSSFDNRESWQMTLPEWQMYGSRLVAQWEDTKDVSIQKELQRIGYWNELGRNGAAHKYRVKQALLEGKEIPNQVMQDYKDLQ